MADKKKKDEPEAQPEVSKSAAAKLKARAKELDKEIGAYNSQERESAMSLGWAAAEMKRGNLWLYIGYEDEPSYRQGKNIGRSTYFRYRRLADAFWRPGNEGLSRSEFIKMKAENADHLAELTEDKRFNEKLIKQAQTLTEEEFEKIIIKFKAKEDRIDEGDVIVTLKWRMPEGRRAVILDTIKWFIEKQALDSEDESRALELMCAEIKGRNPIVTAIMRSAGNLLAVRKLCNGAGGNMSADEVLHKVGEGIDLHFDMMAKAAGVKTEQLVGQKSH